MASVTRSTSWAGRLCWTLCKEKAVLDCLQGNFREDHITNLRFLQIKRLVYKTVTELFGIKLLDYIQNFDLCHPVGYEVFSVGGVGIPVDALKRKPPAKCITSRFLTLCQSLLKGY